MKTAIWNSRGGLSSTNDQEKINFVNNISADLIVISDYGRALPTKKLLFSDIRHGNRILAGCRSGYFLDGAPKPVDNLSSFLPLRYQTEDGSKVNILAAYAVTPIPCAHLAICLALTIWSDWLSEGPSLIMGDLNVWLHLKNKSDARTSANVLKKLYEKGYKSAFHVANNVVIGQEQGVDQFTFVDRHGPTHIDFIFFSPDIVVISENNQPSIKHRFRGEKKLADHSAVMATFKFGAVV